jgi:hypothetical protein
MKRQTATIAKILTVQGQANDFDVTVTYNGSNVTIVSDTTVRAYLNEHYYEWSAFVSGDTDTQIYTSFKNKFAEYVIEMRAMFERIYAALMQEYDPTGDYSRHETTSYKNTHEVEYGKVATNTANNYTSETEYNSTVGDDIKTYDVVNVADAQSTSKTGTDTTTISGSMETELSGTDTITDTRLANDNVRDVVGNNNSPQQSILDEINLRIHNDMTDIVMQGFSDRYLFLVC